MLPAPIILFSPILTPFNTVTFTPNQTLLPIVIGFGLFTRLSSRCQSESVINVLAPHLTLSPITIFSKQPITVPLKPQLLPMIISLLVPIEEMMQGLLIPIKLETDLERNVQLSPILIEQLDPFLK